MLSRLALLIVVIACLAGGADVASAQDKAAQDETPICTPAVAVKATATQIAGDQARWRGRCVTLSGIARRGVIHDDLDALYRPTGNTDPSESGAAVGLDNRTRLDRVGLGFRRVTVTGRVQDCQEVRDGVHASAGPDEFVMVMGYCHYHNGAYLWVEAVQDRGAVTAPRHLVGGPQAGDLTPAPADWPWRDKVTALAGQYLTALRAGDWKTFAALHSEDPDSKTDESAEALKIDVFSARRSAFAALRAMHGEPQIQILLDRQYDPEDGYASTICFCLTKDCKGRWPIATFDADNRSHRPYACTVVREWSERGKTRPFFNTEVDRVDGLPEPGV